MSDHSRPTFLWWIVLALHCAAIIVGLGSDEVLTAIASGSLVLVCSVWFSLRHGRTLSFMLPLVFVAININTFSYMNWLYLHFTNQPTGVYHDLTAWLAALISASAMVGALLVHAVIGRERLPTLAPAIILRPEPMIIGSLVFGAMAAGQLATGWLNSRWEQDGSDFGATYLLGGLGPLGFMYFLLVGTRMRGPLHLPRNALFFALVGVLALLQGLSGGRVWSVYMVLLMLGGMVWAGTSRRQLWLATAICVVGMVFFSMVVQEARGRQGFGYGSVNDRADVMLRAAQEIGEGVGSETAVFEPLIARMFEFSAQVVIDQTALTRHFVGFQDFERLRHLFVPKVFAPDKLGLSDGKEILMREFGFVIGDTTGIPITLIADAYRRGGVPWVLAVGFLVGASLRLLTRLTVLLIGAELALVPLALYTISIQGLPYESVLGSISVIAYHWTKQIFLFACVALLIRAAIGFNQARARQRGSGHVTGAVH